MNEEKQKCNECQGRGYSIWIIPWDWEENGAKKRRCVVCSGTGYILDCPPPIQQNPIEYS